MDFDPSDFNGLVDIADGLEDGIACGLVGRRIAGTHHGPEVFLGPSVDTNSIQQHSLSQSISEYS